MMLPVLSGIRGALQTDGVYYTNVYEDARLEEEVVTMSRRIDGTDNVVAADIYPSDLTTSILEDLPEQSHYYLSDGDGEPAELAYQYKGAFQRRGSGEI